MWRRVVRVRTDISDENIESIIRVKRFGELETTLAAIRYCKIPSSLIILTQMMKAVFSFGSSVHKRAI
jgi:hypothetical protein